MLPKTRNILSLVEEILERIQFDVQSDKAFIEALITNYLAVISYSEVEDKVGAILHQRFNSIVDPKVSNFLVNGLQNNRQGRLKKSDVADLAKRFGADCKSEFNDAIESKDETYYSNFIDCRHDATHGTPRTETILTAQNGISAAESLLSALESAIK